MIDSIANPRVKTMKGEEVGARSLAHNISGVKRCVRTPGWGLRRFTSKLITHTDMHKLNNKLVRT